MKHIRLTLFLFIAFACSDLNDGFQKFPHDDILTRQEQDSILREIVVFLEEIDLRTSDSLFLNDYELVYFLKSDSMDYFLVNYSARLLLSEGKICYGGTANPNIEILFDREIPTNASVESVDSLFIKMINGGHTFKVDYIIND